MAALLPVNRGNIEWYAASETENFEALAADALGAEVLGVDSVERNVRPRNTRAIRCYRKCGFEETGRFVKPNSVAVVHMKKGL